MSLKDPEAKLAARKLLIEADGAMAKKMRTLESMVAAIKTEFYCGESPTLADFHLYTWMSFIRTGCVCQDAFRRSATVLLETLFCHVLRFCIHCDTQHR
jgi:glutathione S-transferase